MIIERAHHKRCITPDIIDSIMTAIRDGDWQAVESALKPHTFLDMLYQMGITRGMTLGIEMVK